MPNPAPHSFPLRADVDFDFDEINGRRVRVLMVEDNLVLRELVQMIVDLMPGVEWMGGCSSVAEANRMIHLAQPDIVMLDIHLTEGSGWDMLPPLMQCPCPPKIIVVSGIQNDSVVVRASRPPFFGHIDKTSSDMRQWRQAMLDVTQGRRHLSAWFKHRQQQIRDASSHWSKLLSTREIELLPFFGRGFDNNTIATRVHLTPDTVQSHRKAVMRKLAVRSTPLLVRWVRDHFYPL